jgi:hypothetical protein
LQPQEQHVSPITKTFNPLRLVRFHNNTKHPNSNREWHATTSIDVLSLSQLRSRLQELIEMHHSKTKQSYSLFEAHQGHSDKKQQWTIQTICIVWNMPPETKGLQDVRTPLDDDNWKKMLEKMVLRNAGDLLRVQYERKREVKRRVVACEMVEDCVLMERYR